jgi:hypothetical protein
MEAGNSRKALQLFPMNQSERAQRVPQANDSIEGSNRVNDPRGGAADADSRCNLN